MSGPALLIGILLGYLVFLFLVAALAERFGERFMTPRLRTTTYVLAISVYCTAWTFYGSVGLAANRGLEFLTIYLGPALVALLWPTVLRKLVRVAKEQRITTISDLIASRYGKSGPLGTLVAVLVVCGMIPYIALQLKAVSASFRMMIAQDSMLANFDPSVIVAVTLGFFGILFGARNLDFTRQQTGLMTAVAVESLVKLVAFIAVGTFVTWTLFDGFDDIFTRAAAHPEWTSLLTLDAPPAASYTRWTAMLFVSMVAVMLLPRQFHVLVVQNPAERDVHTAAWAFPLYLLAINVFVLPIAFGGLLYFGDATAADSFILGLPLGHGARLMAVIVFLGGFSAATAMIVVDSLALSKMVANDIVLPFIVRNREFAEVYWAGLAATRLGVILVLVLGLMWAQLEGGFLLVEMGLLSFIAVAQCAPAIFLGLYWRRGGRRGAFAGISLGFAMWFYTLIVPALVRDELLPVSVLTQGPFGIAWLRPTALFGLEGLDPLAHGVFWSLLVNVGAYLIGSVTGTQDADERSQAAAFVGHAEKTEAPRVPAILSVPEIERLIHLYVPEDEADAVLREIFAGKSAGELTVPELLEARVRLERVLAGSLGAAAARYIVEDRFTISTGEAAQLVDSFRAMQRSLRTSEHLLASVVESVEDCIFTTDVEGRLVSLNRAGQRLMAVKAAALVPALTCLDLLDEGERKRVGPALARVTAEGRAWRGNVVGITRAGQRFPAHLALACVFDAQRKAVGAVGVLRDLTEQVATQQRLIQREKLASLGEMAAGVAHEIRNPLGGIKMATRLLASRDAPGAPISQEMAQSIVSGIAEIESIIADLLDYARDTRLDLQEYPLARILEDVVNGCRAEAEQHGIEVRASQVDPEIVALVDGPRLRQVFTNVLTNALEATDRQPRARVEVRLFRRGASAVAEVRDNGVGMAAEQRDKVFLPFFTTKPTGTGLGMAIVKKIMDLHNGEIEIDSLPGGGTAVRLVIPRAAQAAAAERAGA